LSGQTCLQHRLQADYNAYLKYLISGLNKQKKAVLNIFHVWDDTLFLVTSDMGFGMSKNRVKEDANRQVMDMLNVAEEELEEEEEELFE
jgi:hypothetical protein